MVPVTPGAFVFDPGALVKIRSALGLSQVAMAARLGVPQNSVSRWETGATTPDADTLAAVFSLAQETGLMVTFFKNAEKRESNPAPALAACYWDVTTLPVPEDEVGKANNLLIELVEKHAHGAERVLLKAFSNLQSKHTADLQSGHTDELLERLGWRVWKDSSNWREEISKQILSDIGHAPDRTVVFLASAEAILRDTVEEARRCGASVYVVTPRNLLRNCSWKMTGEEWFIEWPSVWGYRHPPPIR
ncbi:MAG: helix-turn-helix transcriptional regulator [Dehalococcoidia bacterium]|nr:helix-turn-helix transcriptional regulator [Dehalococcoidia bacterium]